MGKFQKGHRPHNWKGARIISQDNENIFIELSDGDITVVDSEDLEKVEDYSWCPLRNHRESERKTILKYAYTRRSNKTILLHRLIMDAKKGQQIDHIDGNTLNNKKSNLRFVNQSQNNINRHNHIRKKYLLPVGVQYAYARNKIYKNRFIASIKYKGKAKYLGSFNSPQKAHEAYLLAKKEILFKIPTMIC